MDPKTLNIGLSDCPVYLRLSKPLADQQRQSPGIHIRFWERRLALLHSGMISGQLDAGLCQSSNAPAGIEVCALWQDPLVLVASNNHPLMDGRAINSQAMAPFTWITLDRDVYAGYREQLDLMHYDEHVLPSSIIAAQSFDLMMTLVAAGYGVCLAPISHVQRYSAFGVTWRAPEGRPLALSTYLLHRRNTGNSMLERLVNSLRARS